MTARFDFDHQVYQRYAALSLTKLLLQGVGRSEPEGTPFRQCLQSDVFPEDTFWARITRWDRVKFDSQKVQAEHLIRLQELYSHGIQSLNELLNLLRMHEHPLCNRFFYEGDPARATLP